MLPGSSTQIQTQISTFRSFSCRTTQFLLRKFSSLPRTSRNTFLQPAQRHLARLTWNFALLVDCSLVLGTVDGANIEIAEEVGEDNVCALQFFPTVRLLISVCWYGACSLLWTSHAGYRGFAVSTHIPPDTGRREVAGPRKCSQHGLLGHIRRRWRVWAVSDLWTSLTRIELTQRADRLLNTVRQGDFYILTDDFDSCASFWWSLNVAWVATTSDDEL